jgi:hypothetical protein
VLSLNAIRTACAAGLGVAGGSGRVPGRRKALRSLPTSPAPSWLVVSVVRWITVIVVLASAGNSLFRGCAAASTQEGKSGREAARELWVT